MNEPRYLSKVVTYEKYTERRRGNPLFYNGKFYDNPEDILVDVFKRRRNESNLRYPEYVFGTNKKYVVLDSNSILKDATKNIYGIDFTNEAKWQLNELIDEWNDKYKLTFYKENNTKVLLPKKMIQKYIDIETKIRTLRECFNMKNFKEMLILMPEIMAVPEHIRNRKFKSIKVGRYSLVVQANDFSFCTPTETLDNLDEYESMEIVLFGKYGQWVDITRDQFIREFPRYNELEGIIKESIYPILAYVPVDLIQDLYEYLHTQGETLLGKVVWER